MNPVFDSKTKSKNIITLVQGPKVIQEEGELVKTFNKFFVSIVKNLGITVNLLPTSSFKTRNVESTIAKFGNHPSIVTIGNGFDKNSIFSFKEIVKTKVINRIKNLNIKKRSLSRGISTKLKNSFTKNYQKILLLNILIYV